MDLLQTNTDQKARWIVMDTWPDGYRLRGDERIEEVDGTMMWLLHAEEFEDARQRRRERDLGRMGG